MRRIQVGDAEAVAALIRAAFSQLPVVIDPPSGALRQTAALQSRAPSSGKGSSTTS